MTYWIGEAIMLEVTYQKWLDGRKDDMSMRGTYLRFAARLYYHTVVEHGAG